MNLFKMSAALTLDSSQYESGLEDSEKKANGFASKLKAGLGSVAKVTGAALAATTGAVVAFGASSVQTGKDFDVGMSQIAATLGITSKEIEDNIGGAKDTFESLRKKALEMGSATNFSAVQAADGLNILAMSGYSAEQSMDMIEDVLHLAAAGSMDMASAAGYISGAMKGFNDETKTSADYANLMAKGATLANTSVAQLGEAMSSGAAGAAAYGQSADSMTLSLLRLAEQGDVGAAAGTALAAAMKNIYTPTDQAKKALDKLGVAAYKDGKALDFNDVVNDLSDALSEMSEEEANAYKQTIFGIQGLDAFNKMTVTGIEKQQEWAEALASASDGMGEAATQYETMTNNLQGDIDIFNSAVDGLKIAVSDGLTPTIREFVQFGSSAIGDFTAAFSSGDIDSAMQSLGNSISSGIQLITQQLPGMVSAGASLLTALVNGLASNGPAIANTLVSVVGTIGSTLLENLPTIVGAVLQLIEGVLTSLGENLPTILPAVVQCILDVATTLVDNLPELITAVISLIEGLAQGILDSLPIIIDKLPEIISGIIDALLGAIPQLIQAGVDLLSSLADNADEIISGIVDSIPKIISGIVDGVLNNLSDIIQAGVDLFIALIENTDEIISGIVDAIPTIITGIVNGFSDKWEDIKQIGADLLGGIWDGISETAQWLWDKISGWAQGVINGVKGFFGIKSPSKVFRDVIGKNIVGGLAEGIDDYGDEAVTAMDSLSNKILNAADVTPTFEATGVYGEDEYGNMSTRSSSIVQNIYAQKMSPAEIFEESRIQLERLELSYV